MSERNKMLKLIKGSEIYGPECLGKKDVLITAEKIGCIQDSIDIGKAVEIETIEVVGDKGRIELSSFSQEQIRLER